jgi:hypothetical protein
MHLTLNRPLRAALLGSVHWSQALGSGLRRMAICLAEHVKLIRIRSEAPSLMAGFLSVIQDF